LPAIWLWPISIWSHTGTRERRHNTEQMAFSVPHPVLRQSLAMWLAGVILTTVAGSGAWVRLALMAEVTSWLAWFVGALFVPSLALALGMWVGNSRAFELVYAVFWYVGVANRVPAFDYAGATGEGPKYGDAGCLHGDQPGVGSARADRPAAGSDLRPRPVQRLS
jgi:hypothetical protein